MPRKSSNEIIQARHSRWRLSKRDGVWYADGRTKARNFGRHSLGTRDRNEAIQRVGELDHRMAIEHGLVSDDRGTQRGLSSIDLDSGVRMYLEHAARPEVLGGASAATQKRYRAVFDKLLTFARDLGVGNWCQITSGFLSRYLTQLKREQYADRTLYLEATTICQTIKWLAQAGYLPLTAPFALKLRRPSGTSTHCWTGEEVAAMIAHCGSRPDLSWLGLIVIALARTGLRIGELAGLRWPDVDLATNMLHVRNDHGAQCNRENEVRRTKNRRDRAFPIHAELRAVLENLDRAPDGRVFRGPRGARLKPDTVRTILVRDVLKPLQPKFPTIVGETGFEHGRLHSFRHYFCSACANERVPERVVMNWLGHADSDMVRLYYHLFDDESRRQMRGLKFSAESRGRVAFDEPAESEGGAPSGHVHHRESQ